MLHPSQLSAEPNEIFPFLSIMCSLRSWKRFEERSYMLLFMGYYEYEHLA